ncbi:MAG: c-type cytochrome [Gemmatimonas sp.]
MMHFMRLAGAAALASTFAAPAIAGGDPDQGAAKYERACTGCHSLDANRVGPAHRGVFGRKAGSAPGYAYSKALKSSSIVWNEETLDRWLTNPQALVPGTRMAFRVSDAETRADIIAFLKRESARKPENASR